MSRLTSFVGAAALALLILAAPRSTAAQTCDCQCPMDPASAAAAAAEATEGAATEPRLSEEPDGDDTEPASESTRMERLKFQAFGLGFHATMFHTYQRYGYTLMGPSVTHHYYVGRRWGFTTRGEIYFPLSGRYAGPDQDFRTGLRNSYDARRLGIDALLGVARRLQPTPELAVMVGFGVHVQSFKLAGDDYAPIEGITGGVGGFARVDWRVHPYVSLGADFALGVDPIDFVRHANRAVLTVPVSLTLSTAFTY